MLDTDLIAEIRHLDFDLECEDYNHPTGKWDHGGPPAHVVTATCGVTVLLCAGFVVYVLAAGVVRCHGCGNDHEAAELTVLPIP